MALTIDLRVAELLCARICHDLVGPVGAVRNGAELLAEETGDFAIEAAKLISDAGGQGAARLEFFRIAFGSAGADSMVPGDRIRSIVTDFLATGKVNAEWLPWPDGLSGGVPRDAAKLLLNLILVGTECVPRGGTLTLGLDGDASTPRVTVTAAGANAALPAESAAAMSANAEVADISARTVPAYLAAKLAEALGIEIATLPGQTEGAVTLSAG
jgi:histidine phosphotransferase ChpT